MIRIIVSLIIAAFLLSPAYAPTLDFVPDRIPTGVEDYSYNVYDHIGNRAWEVKKSDLVKYVIAGPNDNNIGKHSPGVCFYPREWIGPTGLYGKKCRYGRQRNCNFLINSPYLDKA